MRLKGIEFNRISTTRYWMIFSVILAGCSDLGAAPREDSVVTQLRGNTCEEYVDAGDPNESTFDLCAGARGYGLIQRPVGAGRVSLDIVTPQTARYPLHLENLVDSMFHLGAEATWHSLTTETKQNSAPMLLVFEVNIHADLDDPGRVSTVRTALTRVSAQAACVIALSDSNDIPNIDEQSALQAVLQ